MQSILSRDNPRFKAVRGLLEQASLRRKLGQTVLEGTHLLEAYRLQGHVPLALWVSETVLDHPEVASLLAHWGAVATHVLPEALYAQLRSLGPGVDVLGVIALPSPNRPIAWDQDLLVLDRIQDSGNVGTLLRSAAAAGWRQILCTQGTASVWSPRVLRAGMGAQFGLEIHEQVSVATLQAQCQVPLLATSSHAQHSVYAHDLRPAHGWLLGNEGQGVSDELLTLATPLSIPQPGGQESLNVAVAGSICLFEAVRQRLPL